MDKFEFTTVTLPDKIGFDLVCHYLDLLSSIVTESFYVIDVTANRFCYVSPNDLFLCGHSVDDALALGDNFYKKIVHPDDLLLWKKMFKAILLYLNDYEGKQDEVNYFSCTFRLQRKYSFFIRPLSQMVFHRIKPVWEDDKLRYLICSIGSSTANESGNLCMYNKDGLTYEKYNFTTNRWKRIVIEQLTEREKAILMLAKQGKSSKEIANDLCKGCCTIRNQIKILFQKLEVNSMQEAVDFAYNNHIIYYARQAMTEPEKLPIEAPCKRTPILFTSDRLQHIQQYLDDGLSIRQAAKQESVSESAIRYWIKQGKLTIVK